MMQPKKTKYNKSFRGKMRGVATTGSEVALGDFGLQALECGWLDGRQLEAARKAIVRNNKRKGKLWIRVFPHRPITKKPAEVTMGNGKGAVDKYVAVVKPGRVVFEVGGLDEATARESLKLAAQKLPVKTKVIVK
jgi:large subunit ribosomal protein L16